MQVPQTLLKLKSKYLYWKYNSYSETERTYPIIANSTLAILPELFNNLTITTACLYYVDSPTTTLVELIDILDTTIIELKANSKVTKALLIKPTSVTIESFLQDNQSRYIDAPKALTVFKAFTLEYHLLYQSVSIHQLGVEGYNARVLYAFTQSLGTLCESLRSYTYG